MRVGPPRIRGSPCKDVCKAEVEANAVAEQTQSGGKLN